MSILLHKKDCYFIIIAKKYILPFLLKIVLLKDIMFCYFSVDATNVFNYGKFVNDSPEKLANSSMKRKVLNGDVHLCLFAKTDIEINTEIRYPFFESLRFYLYLKKFERLFLQLLCSKFIVVV